MCPSREPGPKKSRKMDGNTRQLHGCGNAPPRQGDKDSAAGNGAQRPQALVEAAPLLGKITAARGDQLRANLVDVENVLKGVDVKVQEGSSGARGEIERRGVLAREVRQSLLVLGPPLITTWWTRRVKIPARYSATALHRAPERKRSTPQRSRTQKLLKLFGPPQRLTTEGQQGVHRVFQLCLIAHFSVRIGHVPHEVCPIWMVYHIGRGAFAGREHCNQVDSQNPDHLSREETAGGHSRMSWGTRNVWLSHSGSNRGVLQLQTSSSRD